MKPKFFLESDTTQPKAKTSPNEVPQLIHFASDESGTKVSLWTCSFRERLKFLFHGNIWIGIMHPDKLPPIWVDCKKTVFNKKSDNNK